MLFICICIGYFLGALPFGYLIARAHGICIFTSGSGNPGATNVLRTLGKKAGYTVFILDTGKGLLAAYIGVLLNFLTQHFSAPYWDTATPASHISKAEKALPPS